VLQAPLTLLSPSGRRGKLTILIFHRVLPQVDPLLPDLPDAAGFEAQMRWVRDWFHVMPLSAAVDALKAASLPARALAITFDDGYADNEEIAGPILRRLGLTATFFIATGYLAGGECMWNDRIIEAIRGCRNEVLDLTRIAIGRLPIASLSDRRRAIASVLERIKHLAPSERSAAVEAIVAATGAGAAPSLMMRPEQVRRLRALGMDIGAHTVSHPILTRLTSDAALQEIAASKETLQGLLGEAVSLFAYPNGVPGQDYDERHVEMVRRCGFAAAVSTACGVASRRSDLFQLPRFTPWDRTRLRYGVRLLWNLRKTEHAVASPCTSSAPAIAAPPAQMEP
jgi:peptidoglycan/xylan/chitin deacetylase (PgdA/CDA1 family)